MKNIDTVHLETILSNIVLNSNDSIPTDEELEALGLKGHLEIFKKLFGIEEKLSSKEIKNIFELIDTTDFILLKQIFHLILQKSSYSPKGLYDEYHKLMGKIPFPLSKLNYVYTTEIADDMQVLELFFKDYILLENKIQEVSEKTQGDPEDITIQIPFDIKAYNLEKKYPKKPIKIIKRLFSDKRELIIPVFKMVLANELKRLKVKFKGLLVSFFYFNDTPESMNELRNDGFFFDDIKELYDSKLEQFRRATEKGEIRKFIILHGYYISQKNKIDFDWTKEFKIRDKNQKRIPCKISHNRTYFNKFPIEIESEVELQGILKVDYNYKKKAKTRKITKKYIEVIDIKIIDNFKVVNYCIGTRYSEVDWLMNTREGLSLVTYSEKKGRSEEILEIKILRCPLILIDVYKGQNERLYEIKVNGELIVKPKKDLIEELDERNQIINKNLVHKAVSQILEETIKINNLKTKPMYNTIGIFLDEKKNFVIVYEDNENHRIVGENDIQAEIIDLIRERELDKEGKLAKVFFEISHNPTLSQNVRLSLLGFSAIHPFFHSISNKIEFFPLLFLIGVHGSGKTTSLEIFMNLLFGTILKTSDDVGSMPRLTKFLTESMFALNIDDMNKLLEDHMGFLKSYATRRGSRKRMDNQKIIKEQMYASICGSANTNEFLIQKDDQAFRIRCIIHYLKTRISHNANKVLLRKFDKNYERIKESNLIFGFYLLSNAFEYIDQEVPGKMNQLQKLLKLYKNIYEKIDEVIEKNNVKISDIRRLKLYSLLYLGWQFWDYTFKSKGLKSDLLEEVLNLENDVFLNYIKELEKAEQELNLEIFNRILEFFRQDPSYGNNKCISKDEIKNNITIVTTKFITNYDKWARERGYPSLGSLKKLGELQSELLNREIQPTTLTYHNSTTNWKGKGHALLFYDKEIIILRNNGFINQKEIDDDFTQEPSGKIDMDRIFVGESRTNLNRLETLTTRLKEIFEENSQVSLNKENIIQILELEENLDTEYIENALKEMIREGTLYEPKKEFIKWVE